MVSRFNKKLIDHSNEIHIQVQNRSDNKITIKKGMCIAHITQHNIIAPELNIINNPSKCTNTQAKIDQITNEPQHTTIEDTVQQSMATSYHMNQMN